MLHIGKIIRKHKFTFHIYSYDTQVYIGFKPEDAVSVLERLEKCVEEISYGAMHACLPFAHAEFTETSHEA